jgi:hypothetical protein
LEYFSWGLGEGSFTQGGSDSPEAEDIGVQFGLSSAIVFVIPPVTRKYTGLAYVAIPGFTQILLVILM